MLNIRRSLRAAAAAFLIAAGAAGGAALAQETPQTVGPPQLKDFSLPGQRTTPPATTQPPAQAPAPAPTPRAEPRPAEPAPRAATPAPRTETPAAERTPPAAAPAPAPSANEPIPELIPEEIPDTNAAAPAPVPQAAPPVEEVLPPVVADPEEAPNYLKWLLFALPVAAIGLVLFGLSRFRRRRRLMEEEQIREAARDELGDSLFAAGNTAQTLPEPLPELLREPAAPQPAPAPVISDAARAALAAATAKRNQPAAPAEPRTFTVNAPAPVRAAAPEAAEPETRAWLEIDIEAEKATATDSEAAVHYNMILRNTGTAAARNIRIDARLFNAADEADMMAFFQGPIHDVSGSPHVVIQPESGIYLLGQVAMPKQDVREVRIEGRALFIPMVAINVAYDWDEDGKGRTSKSWLVGRQTEQPTAKMGAFRLDLGPRIYRQVAQREGKRVMV